MKAEKVAIGVDVGGTNIVCGAVNQRGEVIESRSLPVLERSIDAVVTMIGREVSLLEQAIGKKVLGVGCGIPGIVNTDDGVVYQLPHFPAWRDAPIRELLAARLGLPVVVDNDANMFATGELFFGAGKGKKNFIMLTLGTGIGGGIVIDGRLFHGDIGFAAEVGHMVIEADGLACPCGGHGCWERYAASQSFLFHLDVLLEDERQEFLRHVGGGERLSAEVVGTFADQGDVTARKLWERYGRSLGVGISSLINVLGMTTFVIGGGISKSWNHFIKATRAEITLRSYPKNVERLVLLPAGLGHHAGVIGAAAMLMESQQTL